MTAPIGGIGRQNNPRTITSSATASLDDYQVLCDCTSGAITYTLYPSPGDGQFYELIVQKTDSSANAVTITDGTFSFSLASQNDSVICQLAGSTWIGVSGFDPSGSGDFEGPSSSTDNAVVRFDGTTGKQGQNSAVLIADTTGLITGTQGVTISGATSGSVAVAATATGGGLTAGTGPTTLTDSAGKILSAALNTVAVAQGGTGVTASTGTVAVVLSTTPTLVTPVLGVATGTSLAVSGLLTSSSPTAGIGYVTGAGGAQTQSTDKSTTVASNTLTTAITMNNAALNAGVTVGFTFTNTTIAATDTVICTHQSAGTSGAYTANAFPSAGSAVISVRNNTAGNLSEAIVLRVTVIKSVSA